MQQAALGFRVHLGWAAAVALAAPVRTPTVIERRRIVLTDPLVPESREPYHAARVLDGSEAEGAVHQASDAAMSATRKAVRALIAELRAGGTRVVATGILLAGGRPLPPLDRILASHALVHTAEGVLFRRALREASEGCDVPVTGVREKEMYAQGAKTLRLSESDLQKRVSALGQSLGPPWSQDQKGAALVAWLALASEVWAPAK